MASLKDELIKELDSEVPKIEIQGYFKKGKARIIIIYEDLSFIEYYKKLKSNYVIEIKKKSYIIIPSAIIRGKNPTLAYYFNNPMPIKFVYQNSKIVANDLNKIKHKSYKDHVADTVIDAEMISTALNSNIFNKMYQKPFFTVKTMLIILGATFIVLMIILHFTGVIDIGDLFNAITGQK